MATGLFIGRFQPFLFKINLRNQRFLNVLRNVLHFRHEQRKCGISLRSIPRTGLFIGRFQPFHKGHLSDINAALKDVSRLIIAVGSSQYSNTKENPFSAEERVEMIKRCLAEEGIKSCILIKIPDIDDDKMWVSHLESLVPKFDIVFTGNRLTETLFKKAGYGVKKVSIVEGINGTTIRDKIIKNQEWQSLVPSATVSVIEKSDGVKRIKYIAKKRP